MRPSGQRAGAGGQSMQTALVVVLVMLAMFIGSWLIGTVHDKAKGSETVRRWYRGTVPQSPSLAHSG